MVVGYRGNLAIEHLRAGDSARAVEELERVLADTERLRGPEHPNTAYLHTRLGQALVEEHRTEEGLAEIRRGLITQQTMLGPSHPDVLETVALLEQITRRNAEEPRL
jgi:hypothetical protein